MYQNSQVLKYCKEKNLWPIKIIILIIFDILTYKFRKKTQHFKTPKEQNK